MSADEIEHMIHEQFRAYRATLQDDRRHLLERFEVVDVARKVVGVGSVGTRAFIVLLQGRDQHDPLFLQVKEATASVLEDHLPKSRYQQAGERVVQGQRMMQAASDIFLGWTKGVQENRYLYWRQFRDMKGSAVVETMVPDCARLLRAPLRPDAGAGPRTIRRPDRDRRVPRQEGPVRPVDHRLLRTLRRPERARLRGVHRGDPDRPARGTPRRLITAAWRHRAAGLAPFGRTCNGSRRQAPSVVRVLHVHEAGAESHRGHGGRVSRPGGTPNRAQIEFIDPRYTARFEVFPLKHRYLDILRMLPAQLRRATGKINIPPQAASGDYAW